MQYNGEMYASIGEFEDCEFKDEENMRELLGTDYNSDMSKVAAEGKYPLLIGHSLAGRTRLRNIYEVANFICTHGQYCDLHITLKDGTPFLDTFGIYNLILKSLKLIFCVRYCPCDERKNKYFAFERCFPIQKYWGMAQAGRSDLQTIQEKLF